MAQTGIKDAHIPFTNQGIFVFKVLHLTTTKKSVKSDFTDLSL